MKLAEKVWIVSGSDGALRPGFYRARLGRDEPEVAVSLEETYPADENGLAIGDATYELFVNGRKVPDFERRFERFGLTGVEITEDQYRALLAGTPFPNAQAAPGAAPAQGETMKILKLEAENVKKLRAVEITPEGNLIQIAGDNDAGKSTLLDCIFWALAGKDAIQRKPIRTGCEEAVIKLDLGEIKVRRNFRAAEDGGFTTSLAVENGEGARFKSPQAMLDGLLGALTFDPLEFVKQDSRKQFDTLRRLTKVDVDFDQLDGLNRSDYERRTEINRQAAHLRAQAEGTVVPPNTPPEKIDTAALLDRIENAARTNAEIVARQQRREKVALDAKGCRDAAAEKRAKAADLRRQADQLDADAFVDDEQAESLEAKLANAETLPDPVDISAVRAELDGAEAINRHVDAAVHKADLMRQAKEKEAEAEKITAAMKAREQVKADAIAKARMPVDGLGFGDGFVTFNGEPFDQASTAQQIKVSVAIAMAGNPKLRVVRIKEGSLLGPGAMETIAQMAREHDFQVWVEVVRPDSPVGIVIEDGGVVSIDGRPTEAPKPAPAKGRRSAKQPAEEAAL